MDFVQTDDVAIELSTILEELSAVQCNQPKNIRPQIKTPIRCSQLLKTRLRKLSSKEKLDRCIVDPEDIDAISGLQIHSNQKFSKPSSSPFKESDRKEFKKKPSRIIMDFSELDKLYLTEVKPADEASGKLIRKDEAVYGSVVMSESTGLFKVVDLDELSYDKNGADEDHSKDLIEDLSYERKLESSLKEDSDKCINMMEDALNSEEKSGLSFEEASEKGDDYISEALYSKNVSGEKEDAKEELYSKENVHEYDDGAKDSLLFEEEIREDEDEITKAIYSLAPGMTKLSCLKGEDETTKVSYPKDEDEITKALYSKDVHIAEVYFKDTEATYSKKDEDEITKALYSKDVYDAENYFKEGNEITDTTYSKKDEDAITNSLRSEDHRYDIHRKQDKLEDMSRPQDPTHSSKNKSKLLCSEDLNHNEENINGGMLQSQDDVHSENEAEIRFKEVLKKVYENIRGKNIKIQLKEVLQNAYENARDKEVKNKLKEILQNTLENIIDEDVKNQLQELIQNISEDIIYKIADVTDLQRTRNCFPEQKSHEQTFIMQSVLVHPFAYQRDNYKQKEVKSNSEVKFDFKDRNDEPGDVKTGTPPISEDKDKVYSRYFNTDSSFDSSDDSHDENQDKMLGHVKEGIMAKENAETAIQLPQNSGTSKSEGSAGPPCNCPSRNTSNEESSTEKSSHVQGTKKKKGVLSNLFSWHRKNKKK